MPIAMSSENYSQKWTQFCRNGFPKTGSPFFHLLTGIFVISTNIKINFIISNGRLDFQVFLIKRYINFQNFLILDIFNKHKDSS